MYRRRVLMLLAPATDTCRVIGTITLTRTTEITLSDRVVMYRVGTSSVKDAL